MGRLIIPLFLIEKGILKRPVLYLSEFFEKHRMLYYTNLTGVRFENNLGQWFKFFLQGIIDTAEKSIETFDRILKLQEEVNRKMQFISSRSANVEKVIQQLYQNPIIDAKKVRELTGLSMPTVYKLLTELMHSEILQVPEQKNRGRKFVFSEYLQLFQ